jgi:hypothetical protein
VGQRQTGLLGGISRYSLSVNKGSNPINTAQQRAEREMGARVTETCKTIQERSCCGGDASVQRQASSWRTSHVGKGDRTGSFKQTETHSRRRTRGSDKQRYGDRIRREDGSGQHRRDGCTLNRKQHQSCASTSSHPRTHTVAQAPTLATEKVEEGN